MNIWRMKLRVGNHGPAMFPQCHAKGIVSYTHGPILETDFSNLQKTDIDPQVKGSARPSIFNFAWKIKGGDVIYIGDSTQHKMIARAIVDGEPGERAYRFNAKNAIHEPNNPLIFWRHEIPVSWDETFEAFVYKDPAPQNSVFRLRAEHLKDWGINEHGRPDNKDQAKMGLMQEMEYQRQTPAMRQTISRLHARLSNHFSRWLRQKHGIIARQELDQIDVVFNTGNGRHLAELKVCYGGDTRHAIREAIGQLLEYNHYHGRQQFEFWWLVLDCKPEMCDRMYVRALQDIYRLPITLAWEVDGEFVTATPIPL